MALENWVLSVSSFKSTVLKITDIFLNRVSIERLDDGEDTEGAKAVWAGEPGERTLEIDAPTLRGTLNIAGDRAPKIEYWQKGSRRGFALRNPKSVSFEIDEEVLERMETGKAAGIAVVAGAFAGFIGWLLLVVVGRAALVKAAEQPTPVLRIESDADQSEVSEEEGRDI